MSAVFWYTGWVIWAVWGATLALACLLAVVLGAIRAFHFARLHTGLALLKRHGISESDALHVHHKAEVAYHVMKEKPGAPSIEWLNAYIRRVGKVAEE